MYPSFESDLGSSRQLPLALFYTRPFLKDCEFMRNITKLMFVCFAYFDFVKCTFVCLFTEECERSVVYSHKVTQRTVISSNSNDSSNINVSFVTMH